MFLCSYFQDVLQSSQLTSDDNEIQLNQDGSWSTHVEKNGSCSVESPQKPVTASAKVEVISVDLDASVETSSQQSSVQSNMLKMCLRNGGGEQATGNGSEGVANGETQASSDTVDLTLSDSDDDQPQKRAAGKK